jgi:hypothetical protein
MAVFNTTGMLVYENNNVNDQTVDLSFLPNGIYIFKIITNDNIPMVQKAIKN